MRRLLIGSAIAVSIAFVGLGPDAANAQKPVDYVKICSLYGGGFYYIPGTDTCIKAGGYARVSGALGFSSFSGTGTFTGIDTLAAPPTDARAQDFSHTTIAGGASMELDLWEFFDLAQGRSDLEVAALFIGTDIVDPGEATANFSGVNAVPLGSGTSHLKQTWAVPLYAGLRAPAKTLGINCPGLEFLVRGGVSFDRWRASFSLTEIGAGAGAPGTAASDTWWSADPTVGVGARYHLADGWIAGVIASWAFADSHSLSAHSPNFASESYTLSTGDQTITTVMFTLGKQFAWGR